MQKENTVIKNYILSPQKRILKENPPLKTANSICLGTLLYHEYEVQNKDSFYPFLSRK